MTSTKSFSTKNAGILVVAIFSIAISMGLSQVTSSVMAQTDIVDCSSEVESESNNTEMNNTRSCVDEEQKDESNDSNNDSGDNQLRAFSTSSNNDEDKEEEEEVEQESGVSNSGNAKSKNVVSTSPASADPEDNIIKPINLNKGFVSDKPLKTNNMNNNNQDEDAAESMKVIKDELELEQQLDKTSSVSEVYESFDLPYTALYKNP